MIFRLEHLPCRDCVGSGVGFCWKRSCCEGIEVVVSFGLLEEGKPRSATYDQVAY